MQSYDTFPPCDFLLNILKMVPESAFTYIQAYHLKNKNNQFYILKRDCRSVLLMSPTLFRNHMLPLAGRGLLTMEEDDKAFMIDLTIA